MAELTHRIAVTLPISDITEIDEMAAKLCGDRSQMVRLAWRSFMANSVVPPARTFRRPADREDDSGGSCAPSTGADALSPGATTPTSGAASEDQLPSGAASPSSQVAV